MSNELTLSSNDPTQAPKSLPPTPLSSSVSLATRNRYSAASQGRTLVHFSAQAEPFRSHLPMSPCLIDWGKIMHPTYPAKRVYVELKRWTSVSPCRRPQPRRLETRGSPRECEDPIRIRSSYSVAVAFTHLNAVPRNHRAVGHLRRRPPHRDAGTDFAHSRRRSIAVIYCRLGICPFSCVTWSAEAE
jgi:hypothetical protein